MAPRSAQPFPCGDPSCNAAGADIGDLEQHVLFDAPNHWPADDAHVTQRMRDHRTEQGQHAQIREALAEAAGVTVDELRAALRGSW